MANSFQFQDQTISVGDTVIASLKVQEGDKERIQDFQGIIISIKGAGTGKSFVIRKISTASVGVERIIPVNSPNLAKIQIKSRGNVRRSKLYYLRDRIGKRATRVKLKLTDQKNAQSTSKTAKTAKKATKFSASKTKKASPKTGTKRGVASKKTSSK